VVLASDPGTTAGGMEVLSSDPGGRTVVLASDPGTMAGWTVVVVSDLGTTAGVTEVMSSDPGTTAGGAVVLSSGPGTTAGETEVLASDPRTTAEGTMFLASDPGTTAGGSVVLASDPGTTAGETAVLASDPGTTAGGTVSLASDPGTTAGGTVVLASDLETTAGGTVTLASSPGTTAGGSVVLSSDPGTTAEGTEVLSSDPGTTAGGTVVLASGPGTSAGRTVTLSSDPGTTAGGTVVPSSDPGGRTVVRASDPGTTAGGTEVLASGPGTTAGGTEVLSLDPRGGTVVLASGPGTTAGEAMVLASDPGTTAGGMEVLSSDPGGRTVVLASDPGTTAGGTVVVVSDLGTTAGWTEVLSSDPGTTAGGTMVLASDPGTTAGETAVLSSDPGTTAGGSVVLSSDLGTTAGGTVVLASDLETTAGGTVTLASSPGTTAGGSVVLSSDPGTTAEGTEVLSSDPGTTAAGTEVLSSDPGTKAGGTVVLASDPEMTAGGSVVLSSDPGTTDDSAGGLLNLVTTAGGGGWTTNRGKTDGHATDKASGTGTMGGGAATLTTSHVPSTPSTSSNIFPSSLSPVSSMAFLTSAGGFQSVWSNISFQNSSNMSSQLLAGATLDVARWSSSRSSGLDTLIAETRIPRAISSAVRSDVTWIPPEGISGTSKFLRTTRMGSVGGTTSESPGFVNVSSVFVYFSVVLYNRTLESFSIQAQKSFKQELAIASGLNTSSWQQLISVKKRVFGSGVLITVNISLIDTETAKSVVAYLTDNLKDAWNSSGFAPAETMSIPKLYQRDTFTVPSLAFFYPAVIYSSSISILTVNLDSFELSDFSHLQVKARNIAQHLNISIVSFQLMSDSVSLVLKLFSRNQVGEVYVTVFDDRDMIPISFVLICIPKKIAIGNFQPRGDYIYGGSTMSIQIHNAPETLSCSNISFFFLSNAQCLSVRYNLHMIGSATVSILIPPVPGPSSILPIMSLQGHSRQYTFPDFFLYIEPPKPTIQTIYPKAVPCGISTFVSVNVNTIALLFDESEIVVVLISRNKSHNLMVLDPQKGSSWSDSSAIFHVFFKIATPTLDAAEVSNLLIFNKQYPDYFAQIPLHFIDPSSPVVEGMFAMETGVNLLGSSPLSVGSTSEHTLAVLISNLPSGSVETDLTVHGQFDVKLEYATFSSSSATIVIRVDSNKEIGAKFGMIGFFPYAPTACNVSCCSDSSCKERAKCGLDYKFTCFSLHFFYDMDIGIQSVDNTQG
jgi:hypothetical protein